MMVENITLLGSTVDRAGILQFAEFGEVGLLLLAIITFVVGIAYRKRKNGGGSVLHSSTIERQHVYASEKQPEQL